MNKAIKRILVLTGKPLYFFLTGIFIILASIPNIFKRFELPRIKIPKFKFPTVKLPKITSVVKLRKLRITLFELKIVERLKKFFSKKVNHFQELRLRRRIFTVVILIGFIAIILISYLFIFKGLPSPKELDVRQPEVSTKIYDRNGNLLYKIYKNQNRTIVPLTQIPIHVRLATLAAEDAEFYSHPGFSIKGIFRALIQDIRTGSIRGGSTITQQLVKNTLLTPEKTITRKLKELVLSVEVEANYTKDQILEMYLNEVSYGGTAYGIEEAAESYFGKKVQDLDLAEAALLAGLPKSPTSYSPFGPNPEKALTRQKEVLHLMVINKYITQDQAQAAENEKLSFVLNKTEIKAPHFVMYIRQLLVDKYGEDMVEKGGLEVVTSLDLSIQEATEKIVKSEVEKLKGLRVGNGAALVVNPQTGEILAMVGSKDYFDIAYDGQVNVTTSIRQPGSSIKVVNYAYALSNGYTPSSVIDDSPITYVSIGTTPYSPVNYDGKFKGKVTLRTALAESRNIPAVKVLASYGVAKMVEEGEKMGITTWGDSKNYGLSLTLGGGAVTAIDLSKVYSAIANYGKRPDTLPILNIKDYRGKSLEKNIPVTTQVIDPRVAFILTDILKDNIARAPEFGYNSYLVVKDHPEVAVKTGTSNDLRDNWTVGYTQNYLVLTWVGNNDNSPMSHVASGVTGASPIWNKIMSVLLSTQPSIDWKVPDGVSRVNICTITGTLPCNGCPTKQEWFLDENKPTKYCNPDQIKQILSPTPQPGGNLLDAAASTQITH
jgi:1A family penicillin-binding protein